MRIRTIKPEFWSHPVMARQSDEAKLLAIGLLNYADDEGYFFADVNLIRSALRPLDDNSKIVRRSIDELSKIGYVQLFQSSSHGEIGFIVGFTRHQRVDKPSESTIKTLIDSTINPRSIQDQSCPARARMEGNGKEGNGTCTRAESFEEFWITYSKKRSKGDAERAYFKALQITDSKTILDAVNRLKKSPDWIKEGGKYIPYPATWLNAKGWLDETKTETKWSADIPSIEELVERERIRQEKEDADALSQM